MVVAAAQLREAFSEIGKQFHTENPGSTVEFTFGVTPQFFTRLELNGARADVFAAGNASYMDAAGGSHQLAGAPINFASNRLSIVVAPGNPKEIASFADLNQPALKVAVCATQLQLPGQPPSGGLPCGLALDKIEQSTGVRLTHPIVESLSGDVLQKVINGDVDAGVVYNSDAVSAADKVTNVPFPEAADEVITYPIAVKT